MSVLYRRATIAALLLAATACKSEKAPPSAEAPAQPPAAATVDPGETAQKPEPPVEEARPTPPPAEDTMTKVKTIALKGLEAGAPLEIEVPEEVSLERATPDFAALKGPGVELTVEVPAEGTISLDEVHELLKTGKAEKILQETLDDGEALAYRADGRIYAMVARPKLSVLCSSQRMASDDDARRVVDMCKSLREMKQ